jgi:hypothetical protein
MKEERREKSEDMAAANFCSALLSSLFPLLACTLALAVGPTPGIHKVAWTASPSPGITGYFVYYAAPQSGYTDTQRAPAGTNLVFDLNAFTLGPGVWAIACTATNAAGAESDFSNTILWTNGPALSPPTNLRVLP